MRRVRCIEPMAVFGALPQAQVELDPGVDLFASAQGSPRSGNAGYYAERGGRRTILSARRDGERARGDG